MQEQALLDDNQAKPNQVPAQWELFEALILCREIESVCPKFGCHVALTGGLLYKDGKRKDCDLLFYRIRQAPKIDMDGLIQALSEIGVEHQDGFGWCHKFSHRGKRLDVFFPEEQHGDYGVEIDQRRTPEAELPAVQEIQAIYREAK